MNITVMGTGYVGLVVGACLANLGNNVVNVDVDKNKIDGLNKGEMPIFEPGINDMIKLNVNAEKQIFTTDIKSSIESAEVIFIAVGTPQSHDGQADLKYVLEVAKSIGEHMNGYKVIVDKSTVPVGTANLVKDMVRKHQKEAYEFDVVSNPEFLREGQALYDFMHPDRIVIGVESVRARLAMQPIYKGIERTGKPILVCDINSAELIKYASNAMLATRISFMNMLVPLCEKMGGNVKMVAKGMGLDDRIGTRFLQAGVGYGGSCFPKDVRALRHTLKQNNCETSLLDAVDDINNQARVNFIQKITSHYPSIKGKKFAVWGLAFKPQTDDMREAPAITVIEVLQKEGAEIVAFDPVAEESARKIFKDITYAKTPYATIKEADGLLILTEWDAFRQLDLEKVKKEMNDPIVFDGRNIYEPKDMKELGFTYYSSGRNKGISK